MCAALGASATPKLTFARANWHWRKATRQAARASRLFRKSARKVRYSSPGTNTFDTWGTTSERGAPWKDYYDCICFYLFKHFSQHLQQSCSFWRTLSNFSTKLFFNEGLMTNYLDCGFIPRICCSFWGVFKSSSKYWVFLRSGVK